MSNESYTVTEQNLPTVLESLADLCKPEFNPVNHFGMKYMIDEFKLSFEKLDDNFDGTIEYQFNEENLIKWFEKIQMRIVNETLNKLVDDGMVQLLWDAQTNDFAYKITEKGKQIHDEINKRGF